MISYLNKCHTENVTSNINIIFNCGSLKNLFVDKLTRAMNTCNDLSSSYCFLVFYVFQIFSLSFVPSIILEI